MRRPSSCTRTSRRSCCASVSRKQVITTPGLNWKVPFVETVDIFDKRILDLDTSAQEVTASDQKRLIVDAFARYRIIDPLKFYQNVRYEERVRHVVGPLIESDNPPRARLGDAARTSCKRQARGPDEADRGAGEQGRQGLRPRGRRRAHQARRPARGELQERVRPHARRPRARGDRVPRAGRSGEATASRPTPTAR